jgi:hypothetical protein
MRVPTIDERFGEFLDNPTLDCWLALRNRLVSRADFAPHSPEWRQLEDAFAAGCFAQVLAIGEQLSGRGCLSPRYHFLVGVAAEETGDVARAGWEKWCTQLCLSALFQSGSGAPDDPFLCTYPWDSYDILRALGRTPRGQQLVQHNGRWYDVLAADDEQEYWFDVTELLRAGARRTKDRALEAVVRAER